MSKKNDTPFVKRAYGLGLKAVPNFLVLTEDQITYFEGHLDEIPEALRRGFTVPQVERLTSAEEVETSSMKEEDLKSSQDMETWRFPAVTVASVEPPEKFVLLVDLGIITVPPRYSMDDFKKKYHRDFKFFDDRVGDGQAFFPGWKFHVRIFEQNVRGETTSEERLAFLAEKNAVHLGAVGIALIWEQKKKQLPKSYCNLSFNSNVKENVPGLDVLQYGVYNFTLGDFEGGWTGFHTLLVFQEVE